MDVKVSAIIALILSLSTILAFILYLIDVFNGRKFCCYDTTLEEYDYEEPVCWGLVPFIPIANIFLIIGIICAWLNEYSESFVWKKFFISTEEQYAYLTKHLEK